MQRTEEMVDWVEENHPESIRFQLDPATMKSIAVNSEANGFKTIMYLFGYKFVLSLLKYYEQTEQYEKCGYIVKGIEAHNKVIKNQIPTR